MTIHLRIFGPDEEVPKEGSFFRVDADGWLFFGTFGNNYFVTTPDEANKAIPFISELMELARKGETTTSAEVVTPPDPVSSAILKVGAAVVRAMKYHAILTKPRTNYEYEREVKACINDIAEGLEGK